MVSAQVYTIFILVIVMLSIVLTSVLVYEVSNSEPFEAVFAEKEEIKEYIASFVGKNLPITSITNDRGDDVYSALKRGISSQKGDIIDKGEIVLTNQIYSVYCFFYSKHVNYVVRIKIEATVIDDKEIFVKSVTFLEGQSRKEFLLPSIEEFPNETLVHEAETKILPTETQLKEEEERQKLLKDIEETPQCYGVPDSFTISSSLECELFGGKWDKPVKMSEECPFYGKDPKNPLKGGVNKFGYCQMPIGYELIGYRFFRNQNASNTIRF